MEWLVRLCLIVILLSSSVRDSRGAPQNVSKTVVENLVKDAIEVVSHSIAVAGFDPYHLSHTGFSTHPIPKMLSLHTSVKSVIFNGASHIFINNVTFTHSNLTLFLDLSLPLLYFSVNEACADLVVGFKHYNFTIGGSLLLSEVRIKFSVLLKVLKTGITMSNITVDFTVGDIASDLSAYVFGKNISTQLNDIFNNEVPLFISKKQSVINEALASLVGTLLKEILGT